jgi:hypothetical protein
MTLRECALEIEPSATPERIDEIERSLHKWSNELLTQMAAKIDTSYFARNISYPTQAAALCRDEALAHLNQT